MHWFRYLLAVFVAAGIVTQIAIFATTIFLHRGLTHDAIVKLSAPLVLLFRFIIWLTTGMKPREWVAVHRQHHAGMDTAEDPHSPVVTSRREVQLHNVRMYRQAAKRASTRRYAREMQPDWLDRVFFDHALLGLGVGTAIIVACMWWLGLGFIPGFVVGIAAALLHAVLYVQLSGAINARGHTVGKRPFTEPLAGSATNSQGLALITGGEGLHNNHHHSPKSANFTLGKGGFDPAWPIIRVLVALRLAKLRFPKGISPMVVEESAAA